MLLTKAFCHELFKFPMMSVYRFFNFAFLTLTKIIEFGLAFHRQDSVPFST